MLGVGLAGGWTAVLQLHTLLRQRSVDPFSLYGLAVTVAQATLAAAVGDPIVYRGVGENLLDGLGLFGSIAVSRPLLVEGASWILGRPREAWTASERTALVQLTWAWGMGLLLRGLGLYVALTHLAQGPFLVVNLLAGWPLTVLGAGASGAWVRARLRAESRCEWACPLSPCGASDGA